MNRALRLLVGALARLLSMAPRPAPSARGRARAVKAEPVSLRRRLSEWLATSIVCLLLIAVWTVGLGVLFVAVYLALQTIRLLV